MSGTRNFLESAAPLSWDDRNMIAGSRTRYNRRRISSDEFPNRFLSAAGKVKRQATRLWKYFISKAAQKSFALKTIMPS